MSPNVTISAIGKLSINVFSIVYLCLLSVNLIGGSFDYDTIAQTTKPLLLLSLAAVFFMETRRLDKGIFIKFIQAGLLLSLAGDILLMFESNTFFIGGLVAFLLAHLLYIGAFASIGKQYDFSKTLKRQSPVMFLVLIYSMTFFLTIKDDLGILFMPVLLYISVITFMLLTAISLFQRIGRQSFWLIVLGATLFVISDSVLAWNRFVEEISYSHFFIMLTYGIAQLLIMLGSLRHIKS